MKFLNPEENQKNFELVSNNVATWQELWDYAREKNADAYVLLPLPMAFEYGGEKFGYITIMHKEGLTNSVFVGVNAKNEVIRALPKPFQGYTFDEVKEATLTVKDVWEANKDFASQKAYFSCRIRCKRQMELVGILLRMFMQLVKTFLTSYQFLHCSIQKQTKQFIV